MNKVRKIIHCDADCFFAALEMRDDPSLRGIPMAVGGDPSCRGVISTCNYEARAFGVRSALASAYAKKLCPQLIILPHNIDKYRLAAEQLRKIFMDYTELVESISLDEAFLDVSDTDSLCGSATLIARDIRRRVQKDIGITASAGIAPNKFLAKVASDWDKPDGLTVIEPHRVKFFMQKLPVKCIPGVGIQTLKKLYALGITHCADLLSKSEAELVENFGKFGKRLYILSQGEDDRPVKTSHIRKSISVEHTFNQDLPVDACEVFLQELCQKLLLRIKNMQSPQDAHDYEVSKVFIKIKFMDFSRTTIEKGSRELNFGICLSLFLEAWERYQKPVRLLGIGVRFKQPLIPDEQLELFENNIMLAKKTA